MNDGWKPNAEMPRAISTPALAAAARPGWRATASPIAPNRAASGSRFHERDGQNTRAPRSEAIAGMSVSPARSVAATATASAGPSDRNKVMLESVNARNAMITAPAAVAIAGPTRVTASIIACLASAPARSRSR